MREWIRYAVWWQVYPLGFTDAERSALPEGTAPVPRLRRLEAWLPHLLELGCNGLALGPGLPSRRRNGCDTVDHFRVDRRLGTDDDLEHLVDACHEQGIRALLDGVFNHVGRGSPRFRDVLRRGPDDPSAAWFHVNHAPAPRCPASPPSTTATSSGSAGSRRTARVGTTPCAPPSPPRPDDGDAPGRAVRALHQHLIGVRRRTRGWSMRGSRSPTCSPTSASPSG